MQQKDKRIKDLDNENAKLRKKVITVKQFAYSKKENFERAKKRVAELEAKLSSLEAILTTNRANFDRALNIIKNKKKNEGEVVCPRLLMIFAQYWVTMIL